MTNLYNLAKSGLTAAQVGLATTGNNIANVNTPGYSRQQVVLSTAGGGTSANGHYSGRGVQVDLVRRVYDAFLSNQYNAATASTASLATQSTQISRIDNLLADRTVGLAPAITFFFEGVNAVASKPQDSASRAEMLARAENLTTQFRNLNDFLVTQREGLNQEISTTVDQINSYAQRIHDLNVQIRIARATVNGSQPPNDLLDQRDRLVTELNELVGVNAIEQDGDIMLTLGNGIVLLGGGTVYQLAAVMSDADPTRVVVAQTLPNGAQVQLDDRALSGGQLGGLLQFRVEALDPVQNELGRMALVLAHAFNAQHEQGVDLAGQPGGPFFSIPSEIHAISNYKNADPTGTFSVTIVDSSKLTTSDYQITYDPQVDSAAPFKVVRLSDGQSWSFADLEGQVIDGFEFGPMPATLADGDSFLLQPTRNAAGDIGVAIKDPAKIAAADADGGSANGANALALARLQTAKIVGGENLPAGQGTMSLTEAFSQMVNGVGVKTQAINTALGAQQSLKDQSYAAQQAVSGVNLNEEYINLDMYVQYYQASARLIEVATTLFDTLLGLRT